MPFFKKHGILGINARSLLYIRPFNKKKAVRLADNKLKTKHFLSARGIPVPKLFGVIKNKEEAATYDYNTLPNSFVIKPNFGFGGEGIIPINGKNDTEWTQANGKPLDKDELVNHIIDIIDGRFSLSNIRDTAFFEQLIIPDNVLGQFSHKGLPDIRVVVHNLVPVMAMLRLPTAESGGKANLHQGAIGVGIDIAKGEATYCSYKNKIVEEIPGKGKIRGLKIPFWEDILFIASKTQLITNLGYMAVDIAIDKNSGPVILEINARAGLGVQVANLAPLRRRLERIAGIKVTSPSKGVRVAKDLFGNIVEKEISQISGKKVIGLEESVSLILKDQTYKIRARTNTGTLRSSIDREFARSINLLSTETQYDQTKQTIKLKLNISGTRIQTVVDVKELVTKASPNSAKLILGSRDLRNFIIDPIKKISKTALPDAKDPEEKYKPQPYPNQKETKINYAAIDRQLIEIDSQIKLISNLKPTNLEEEKEKFLANTDYNPQFQYKELKFEPYDLYRKLDRIETDETPLGKLFNNKKEEIEKKIALLEQRGNPIFTKVSIDLYGRPNYSELQTAIYELKQICNDPAYKQDPLEETITAEQATSAFNEIFAEYQLHNWKAKIKESMVADCIAGKNNAMFVRRGAMFSPNRIKNLIVHEIETHIITAENGKKQPYQLFQRGLGNYLITQEGLAVYNTEKHGKDYKIGHRRALLTLVSCGEGINKSFSELAKFMLQFNVTKERAFNLALKVKRGLEDTSMHGGFTKGYVYWSGKKQVEEFINKGGNIKDLYYGKYNIEDLELIKKIPNLAHPAIMPSWTKK